MTREHIVREFDRNGVRYLATAYRSEEGEYALQLPYERCQIIDTESTVEQLALFLAQYIARESGAPVRVRAFEGVQKGALAVSP